MKHIVAGTIQAILTNEAYSSITTQHQRRPGEWGANETPVEMSVGRAGTSRGALPDTPFQASHPKASATGGQDGV
jgi:hypothetical protein